MRRPGDRHRTRAVVAAACVSLLAPALPAAAAIAIGGEGKAELTADFRFRLEADWDSRRANATARDDRHRARVRARLGLSLKPAEGLEIGVRLRSGAETSHQSPHITIADFDGNDTGAADFSLDKWYLEASRQRAWAWAGRNSLPFWRPDELVVDGDVTLAGVAAGRNWGGEASRFRLAGGYFALPVGMTAFSGSLVAGQAVYVRELGGTGLSLAAGFLGIEADPRDPDASRLLDGNGLRDYEVWVGDLQVRRRLGGLPIAVSGAYVHNAEGYSRDDPDPFTAAHFDQTDGWAVSARAGGLKEKRDWLAGYTYARIETLAVNSSYAQDDWVRWGSASETRSTNLRGHELRFAYALSGAANLVVRLYLVDSITTSEDGKRFRIDFNYRL